MALPSATGLRAPSRTARTDGSCFSPSGLLSQDPQGQDSAPHLLPPCPPVLPGQVGANQCAKRSCLEMADEVYVLLLRHVFLLL